MEQPQEVLYNYVEEVDPNLTCAICQSALVDPVTTTSCKHTFCRDCITKALARNPSCPIDRSALNLASLQDTEPLVQLMLDELEVRCDAEGCGQIMQRGLLLAHLRSCKQTIVPCGNSDCGLSTSRNRMPHHRAYECFQRRMECGKCGVVVTFKEAKTHTTCSDDEVPEDKGSDVCNACAQPFPTTLHLHRWICPAALVPCPQSHRGCPAIIPRSSLESHMSSCPFELLSSFFASNDARLSALERRLDEVTAENESLRSQLWSVRRARIVPRSLWTNTGVPTNTAAPTEGNTGDGNENANTDSAPTTADVPQASPPPTQWVTIPAGLTNVDPGTSLETRGNSNSTQSSSEEPTTIRTPITEDPEVLEEESEVLPVPILAAPPRESYTEGVLRRLSPVTQVRSGSEDALRASVLFLATGLDASERRNEIRTMTESLRVREEVDSMRAVVGSMRRQVMSDRSTATTLRRLSNARYLPFDAATPNEFNNRPAQSPHMALPTPQSDGQTSGYFSASSSMSGHWGTPSAIESSPASQRRASISSQMQGTSSNPADSTEGHPDVESGSIRESVVFSAQGICASRSSSSFNQSSAITAGSLENNSYRSHNHHNSRASGTFPPRSPLVPTFTRTPRSPTTPMSARPWTGQPLAFPPPEPGSQPEGRRLRAASAGAGRLGQFSTAIFSRRSRESVDSTARR